ncbi:MAG: diguanylate cyclase [Anaerolineales bacterium]|nr:diguanylate cyclase [Anaerolineales bacterium]
MEKHNAIKDAPQFLRTDPLTGVGNTLAFFEWLLDLSNLETVPPFTLISLDIMNLEELNATHGHDAGDVALRWAALVLLEEAEAEVYRLGGDEFVGVITEGSPESHNHLFESAIERLKTEAELVKLKPQAAFVAMIHYTGLEEISPKDVLGVIYGALIDLKQEPDQAHKTFNAAAMEPSVDFSGLINDLVGRMVALGAMLDESRHLAFTDSITGLPNLHAAMSELDAAIQQARELNQPLTILLVDGDDLKQYNKISYQAGDEMIRNMGTIIQDELRPNDFIARWRFGDEFLILLQDTMMSEARLIAERLRKSIHIASRDWEYPISISIGATLFPDRGHETKELLQSVESALLFAKETGKDKVVAFGETDSPLS